MFHFGSSESTRELYLSAALAQRGPNIPDKTFEELTDVQQDAFFAYVYLAYSSALRDGISGERITSLLNLYDETFLKIARLRPKFRQTVKNGGHVYLPDYSPEVVAKYQSMVDL